MHAMRAYLAAPAGMAHSPRSIIDHRATRTAQTARAPLIKQRALRGRAFRARVRARIHRTRCCRAGAAIDISGETA